jgi:dihydrofolate reductase
MSVVRLEISMSLDGYVTASGVRPDEPMGDGGLRLHEWAFGDDERGRAVLAESQGGAGASIAGRRIYDLSIPWWGPDGLGGPVRTPTFIVSHRPSDGVPEGGVYTFAASPEDAVAQARAVAGDKDVDIFSPGHRPAGAARRASRRGPHPPRARPVRRRHPAGRRHRPRPRPAENHRGHRGAEGDAPAVRRRQELAAHRPVPAVPRDDGDLAAGACGQHVARRQHLASRVRPMNSRDPAGIRGKNPMVTGNLDMGA